jgi:hypothetical protein
MVFKENDVVRYWDCVYEFEVEFRVLHNELKLKGVFISTESIEEAVEGLQGFAVQFMSPNVSYGFCICTETDMNFFLPMLDAISFDDVRSVMRDGVDVLLKTDN